MGLTRENKAEIKELIKQTLIEVLDGYLEKLVDKVLTKVKDGIRVELENMKTALAETQDELDYLKQLHKKKNLIIYGINETPNEEVKEKVIKLCTDKHVNIPMAAIKHCYRIGNKTNNKIRPIVIKFANENYRKNFMSNRKTLSKTGIRIKEDLTRKRLQLFKCCGEKLGFQSVWTYNGNIRVKIGENIHPIKNEKDIVNLLSEIDACE